MQTTGAYDDQTISTARQRIRFQRLERLLEGALVSATRARWPQLQAEARDQGNDLRVVELDVTSQESASTAAGTIPKEKGQLDVAIHDAGHMSLGYFSAGPGAVPAARAR